MSEKAILSLSRDAVLKSVIRKLPSISLKRDGELYVSLLRAIVGQQLSVKAANTIWGRFISLFPSGDPAPELLLKTDIEMLRGAGLSYQKAGYLKNIAEFSITRTLDHTKLKKMSDDELVDYLVQIKGVGRWTAEMILMFNLCRPDVFPKDDLGIQTGMKVLYKLKAKDKKQLYRKMDAIAEQWKPYRTLACMYVWRYKDSLK
jgi:DNA-3-methyladenine glycosylase II